MTDGITLAKQVEDHALSYEGVEAIDTKATKVTKKQRWKFL